MSELLELVIQLCPVLTLSLLLFQLFHLIIVLSLPCVEIINQCTCLHIELNISSLLLVHVIRLVQMEVQQHDQLIHAWLEESVLHVRIVQINCLTLVRSES